MLTRLVIHDVVLIDKLNLALSSGLNVFTGETGAGKSIVLDALGLALGERSDAGLVRQGVAQASVTAEFSLPAGHAANKLAEEQGLAIDDTLVLRRVVGTDGKSRAFINDQPVGVNLLKRVGELLLEIHGQFDTHGLLNPSTHMELLDAFGGVQAEKKICADTFDAWQAAQAALAAAEETRARAAAEEEFLRAAVDELEEMAPEANEADTLAERRTALQHREKITEALQTAEQLLNGDRGALSLLAQAGKTVARVSDKLPRLAELLAVIDRAADEAANASSMTERFLNEHDAEPEALQKIEERLFALRASMAFRLLRCLSCCAIYHRGSALLPAAAIRSWLCAIARLKPERFF